jgi:hypothetical protein
MSLNNQNLVNIYFSHHMTNIMKGFGDGKVHLEELIKALWKLSKKLNLKFWTLKHSHLCHQMMSRETMCHFSTL